MLIKEKKMENLIKIQGDGKTIAAKLRNFNGVFMDALADALEQGIGSGDNCVVEFVEAKQAVQAAWAEEEEAGMPCLTTIGELIPNPNNRANSAIKYLSHSGKEYILNYYSGGDVATGDFWESWELSFPVDSRIASSLADDDSREEIKKIAEALSSLCKKGLL